MGVAVAAAITLWLAPVAAVGVYAFWPSPVPAIAIGLAVAAAIARWTGPALTETIAPALRVRPVAVLTALFAASAIAQIAGISVYMADPSRGGWSYMASDPFRARHSCMTAYVEALRFCEQGGVNIYQMDLYEPRTIGPFRVDSYHYPPPFLLLPALVRAVRPEMFQFRALWFALQCGVLAASVFGLARWIGGRPGAFAAAGGVLAFATPQVVYSLQQGNVQSTAIPAAAVGMLLLWRGRLAAGAPVLAYLAAAKIFPGILLVPLAAARRWKALAATAACAAAIVVLTVALVGVRPFQDFVGHELPRISSGEAFPQAEQHAVSANVSIYGMTVRLRELGVSFLTRPRGLAIASVYGLLVIALAGITGWAYRPDLDDPGGRLRFLQVVLALLLLASFRSPFVGFYGYLGAVWLIALFAAEQPSPRPLITWWIGGAGFAIVHAALPSPSTAATSAHLVAAQVLLCAVLALCVAALIRAWRSGMIMVPLTAPAVASR